MFTVATQLTDLQKMTLTIILGKGRALSTREVRVYTANQLGIRISDNQNRTNLKCLARRDLITEADRPDTSIAAETAELFYTITEAGSKLLMENLATMSRLCELIIDGYDPVETKLPKPSPVLKAIFDAVYQAVPTFTSCVQYDYNRDVLYLRVYNTTYPEGFRYVLLNRHLDSKFFDVNALAQRVKDHIAYATSPTPVDDGETYFEFDTYENYCMRYTQMLNTLAE